MSVIFSTELLHGIAILSVAFLGKPWWRLAHLNLCLFDGLGPKEKTVNVSKGILKRCFSS